MKKQGSGSGKNAGRPGSSRGKLEEAPPGAKVEGGVVQSVHAEKGFGFLKGDDGTVRFFHRTGCYTKLDRLHPGERVTFVASEGPKGPRAITVRREEQEGGEE